MSPPTGHHHPQKIKNTKHETSYMTPLTTVNKKKKKDKSTPTGHHHPQKIKNTNKT
jgi:hypothetical protein